MQTSTGGSRTLPWVRTACARSHYTTAPCLSYLLNLISLFICAPQIDIITSTGTGVLFISPRGLQLRSNSPVSTPYGLGQTAKTPARRLFGTSGSRTL